MVHRGVRQLTWWAQQAWEAVHTAGWFKRTVSIPYTIPILVFVSFLGICLIGSHGPAYMSDEVGYLSKAATIAGSTVHLATSWFGGYSFMISPAFFLSSNPHTEWTIILVLNALMWASSAWLLHYILRSTHPKASDTAIFLATCGAMLYPSWLSMSGYAFATSGFVLVFLASLATILKSNLSHMRWLGVAGILAGYLCWIHPLGFIFLGLFAALLVLQAWLQKRAIFLLVMAGSIAVVSTYLFIIQPWLTHAMSGSVTNDSHYAQGASQITHAIFTGSYWLHAAGMLVGLFLFAIVATFGLIVYGSLPVCKTLFHTRASWKQSLQDASLVVAVLPLLLVLGVIGFTALSAAANTEFRIDQWVYGRYTDMYILPLIGFGLLATWRLRSALYLAGFVALAGIFLSLLTNPENTSYLFNNKVNIQSLWPMHLASIIHANYYWAWALLGTCGVMFVGFMGTNRRKLYLSVLIIPVALAGGGNFIYHQTITREHATVTSLYQYVKANYTRSDCIGFTPDPDNHERFNLYSYYLHGYNVKKMTLPQWQQQHCQGAYFTYDPSLAAAYSLRVAGIESTTNLYMLTPTNGEIATPLDTDNAPLLSQEELLRYAILFQ